MLRRALLVLLLLAPLAHAQDESGLVDGKRVWVSYPGKGWLVPAGRIVGKNQDGSYRVAIYEYDLEDKTRSPARPQDVEFTGLPMKTIDVPAAELARWNTTRFDAWVEVNGQPWPKAKVISDKGTSVTVAVYDTKGEKVSQTLTLTGDDLEKFRELNKLTAPSADLKAEIGPKTAALIDEENRALATSDWKLPSGEAYPKIHVLPEIVSELKAVATRYKPLLERELNVHRMAALQEEMLREVYVKFEELTQIKHSGRPTTTDEWKKTGSDLAAKARATDDPRTKGQELQETLLSRAIACFDKSKVAWELVNLAGIPELTGVGFRLLSWGFHGTVGAKLADGSWREWETTEGFEAPLTRAFHPFSVVFDGAGDSGNGLGHATSGISPLAETGERPAAVGTLLDPKAAVFKLDLTWKGQSDNEARSVTIDPRTGEVSVTGNGQTLTGTLNSAEVARLTKDLSSTDLARVPAKATDDGRGPHFVLTAPDGQKYEGDTQAFGGASSFRDLVLVSQVVGRRVAWDAGLTWGGRKAPVPTGADLARSRGFDRAPSDSSGLAGELKDRIDEASKADVDPADGK
ncbi:MAG TPA: hypothetical protein VFF73_07415 [Planctomycetota bacterium]|nr:hypothetical protein [Planctomycetota bacterium]